MADAFFVLYWRYTLFPDYLFDVRPGRYDWMTIYDLAALLAVWGGTDFRAFDPEARGRCIQSRKNLAKYARMGATEMKKALQRLEEQHLIYRTIRPRKPQVITVVRYHNGFLDTMNRRGIEAARQENESWLAVVQDAISTVGGWRLLQGGYQGPKWPGPTSRKRARNFAPSWDPEKTKCYLGRLADELSALGYPVRLRGLVNKVWNIAYEAGLRAGPWDSFFAMLEEHGVDTRHPGFVQAIHDAAARFRSGPPATPPAEALGGRHTPPNPHPLGPQHQ